MRAVIQRVSRAAVRVDGDVVGSIGVGFAVLLGVGVGDGPDDAAVMADKIAGLRVFADPAGKMNLGLGDVAGAVLLISQFTLLADLRKGRRPSFTGAAGGQVAEDLVMAVVTHLQESGVTVETGLFGAAMEVELVNDGPVTIVLEVIDGAVVA